MEWLTILPALFGLHVLLTDLAHKALTKPEPEPTITPCEHPWYIDGRCMVCGEPS